MDKPIRRTYTHLKCGKDTMLTWNVAKAIAKDSKFYKILCCFQCNANFPVKGFVWMGTDEKVGS